MQIKFLETVNEKKNVINILSLAFPNKLAIARNLSDGVWHNEDQSKSSTLILKDDEDVLSMLCFSQRKIRSFNKNLLAFTVGPVATHPKFTGKGYSSALISHLYEIAKLRGISLIYLNGIDSHYSKFGFFPLLPKQKILISNIPRTTNVDLKISNASIKDLDSCRLLFANATKELNLSAIRDANLWKWLLGFGSRTYYFYGPKKIIDIKSNKIVGYFTTDPDDPGHIREFITASDPKYILSALEVVNNYLLKMEKPLQLYTFSFSPLFNQSAMNFNVDQTNIYKSDGGFLTKIINLEAILKTLNGNFNSSLNDFSLRVYFEGFDQLFLFKKTFNKICVMRILQNCNITDLTIPEKYIPGLIFGMYSEDFLKSALRISKKKYKHLGNLNATFNKKSFIFQGDNF